MRKSLALKTLLRSPLKASLTFLLIAAASFALFSRVMDYAVTTRETENAKSLYHAVASLDNEVPDIPMMVAMVDSPDKSSGVGYDTMYEMEDKPWPTEDKLEEFATLPGVTLADTRYMTAGRVADYKRLVGEGEFGGFVVFEGTYEGYEEGESILEDHVCLKFDDVKVVACDGGPEIETSFITEPVPLGEMYYASSSYTRVFYDSLAKGSRCLVLAENSGYSANGSSGIKFQPWVAGDGSLRVIDGLSDNYLETESFALQKEWVDAINHNLYAYDIVYTSDMRAIPKFNEQRQIISAGRFLTREDTDACVVSEDFLKGHGLSIGDSINIQLGDVLCHGEARAFKLTREWRTMLDGRKIPGYADSQELTIVGAYSEGRGDSVYASSPNTIYVPSALLPVKVPADYIPEPSEFSVFIEEAKDIEAFYGAAQQFAEKVDLKLNFSDRGWLDVKDSFGMGAMASLLTTVLYVAGAVLALFLAVFLYIGRNKKTYAIMRMLGVPGRAAGNAVALPFVAVSVLAVPIGGIAGIYYAQGLAQKALLGMADSAPADYVPNADLSIIMIILCFVSELLFISLAAYFFLRNMKKVPPLELLQEGVKPGRKARSQFESLNVSAAVYVSAKLDMDKLSVVEERLPREKFGAVRHVVNYIWRHIRRSMGRTVVSLFLAAVLTAGIGTLVLARITYLDAFYELGVKGVASDFRFTSVVDLSKSPLVKDFYCCESFKVQVEGVKLDIPMTISNDVARNLGADYTVDYAESYGISAFEGTGAVCLAGKELAEKLGISPGDEIGIMSDILYSILKTSGQGESAISGGYKKYRVIGIAQSEDTSVKDGIFVGIRSDLQSLFSMDFSVDHCEFTLADNEKLDELEAILEEKQNESFMYSAKPSYYLDAGGLADIERVRGLLEALFPIALAAAVLIGLFGPLLVVMQSAKEAAFLRVLGVTKKRARCMLILEQAALCLVGVILVAGGLALYSPGVFTRSMGTLAVCYALYFLGCVCGAVVAAVQITRHRIMELLQVKE